MKYDSVLDQQSISGKIVSLILCVWKPCYVKSGHIYFFCFCVHAFVFVICALCVVFVFINGWKFVHAMHFYDYISLLNMSVQCRPLLQKVYVTPNVGVSRQ